MSLFQIELDRNNAAVIRDNWLSLQADVADAAEAAGRRADEIRIVGVTKYVDAPTAACLVEAGCLNLGESRPQVLWDKTAWMQRYAVDPKAVRWHLIGHLQRNKLRRTIPWLDLMHSVDSLRLASTLEASLDETTETLQALLEINLTGDEAKTGLLPNAGRQILEQARRWKGLQFVGLMGMAGLNASPEECRQQFAGLRQIRDTWQSELGMDLPELSMGMSSDFPAAIAEGATIVRVGSRLFEGITKAT